MITCRLCRRKFKSISPSHLKSKHGLSSYSGPRVSAASKRASRAAITRYWKRRGRHWTSARVLQEIRVGRRHRRLYDAARRLFGSWARALGAAGVRKPKAKITSKYRRWTRERVMARIREMRRSGESLVGVDVRRRDEGFYRAAQRILGKPWRAIVSYETRRRSITLPMAGLSVSRYLKEGGAPLTKLTIDESWASLAERPGKIKLTLRAPVFYRTTARNIEQQVRELVRRLVDRARGAGILDDGSFTFSNEAASLTLRMAPGRGDRREVARCAQAWTHLVFEMLRLAAQLGQTDLTQVVSMVRAEDLKQN